MGMLLGNKQGMRNTSAVLNTPIVEGSTSIVSSGSTISIAIPTGTQVGDILFCSVNIDGSSNALVNVPSGWNLFLSEESGRYEYLSFWRRATGTEGTSLTININQFSSFSAAVLLRISGCANTGTPITLSTSINNIGNRNSQSLTADTTTTSNILAIALFNIYDNVTSLTPSDGNYILEYYVNTTSGSDGVIRILYQELTTSGTNGGAVGYSASVSDYSHGYIITLNP